MFAYAEIILCIYNEIKSALTSSLYQTVTGVENFGLPIFLVLTFGFKKLIFARTQVSVIPTYK